MLAVGSKVQKMTAPWSEIVAYKAFAKAITLSAEDLDVPATRRIEARLYS